MMSAVMERQLHRMAKVHDILEIWEGTQNLRAIPKKSHTENNQIQTIGYISDSKEIVKGSWAHCQHDGAASSQLMDTSHLPPALSQKHLPGGQTEVVNVCQIKELTAIQLQVMRVMHLEQFQTPNIGFAGMGTSIILRTAKTTGRQMLNLT